MSPKNIQKLTERQQKYIAARLEGKSRVEAAKVVGCSNPSQFSKRMEASPRVVLALSNAKMALAASTPVSPCSVVPRAPTSVPARFQPGIDPTAYVAPLLPSVTPLTRDELLSGLTNVVRDTGEPLPARILAAKLVCDLQGWLDPSQRQGDVFVNLGDVEKNL